MSRVYSLSEMVDLALATPKIGVVNCFMLHALLHALIKRLDIGDYSAAILAMGDHDFPWTTDSAVQPEESDASSIVKVSQPDDNIRLQISLPKKTPEPISEKKMSGPVKSKSQRSDISAASPRQGDDAKDKQETLKKQSSGKKAVPSQDSEGSKKKTTGPEKSKSQRAESPAASSRQDGDDVKNKQEKKSPSTKKSSESSKKRPTVPDKTSTEIIEGEGSTELMTDDGDIVSGQDSEFLKEEPTTLSVEEPSQEAVSESSTVSPAASPDPKRHSQSIGLQFGLPYLESGISALADHFQDVPELIKELTDRIAVNESGLKELKENVTEAQEEKDTMEGKVKNIIKSLDSLENKIFQEPADPQKEKELKELEDKMDEMVQMSNALRKKVRSKLKQKDSKDKVSPPKRKSKKESKKSAAAKKEKEPAVATEKVLSPSEGESSDALDKEKTSTEPPELKSTEQQSVDTVLSPQSDLTPEATTSETEVGTSKDTTMKTPEETSATSPFPGERFAAAPLHRRYSQSSMDVLQKKVNMVLRLMCNLEKIVKDLVLDQGKTNDDDKKREQEQEQEDEVADVKPEDGKDYYKEQTERDSFYESPKHKHSQVQIPYQMLLIRMKKLEDDIQKIQQIVSSDTSTSSHLTKMVGDFLSTISNTPEADPQPKRKRKSDRKAKKAKEVEEKDGGEEVAEEGSEKEDVEKEEEGVEYTEVEKKEKEKVEKEEKSDDEGKSKEMESEVIDILKDSEPEKLSDLWDQLKALAQAFRNMKCNVVSLEKNSKNMAKALQLLMRGNTNIIDEDFEMIGEMKMVVRKVVGDINNLNTLVKQDRDTLLNLTVTVDSLLNRFEEMKTLFTGKTENLKDDLIQKAERQDVDNMLASVLKKLNISDYRREMDKLKDDIAEQDQNVLMDIQQLKNDKYDRFEMDIFRMWVECKLSATQKLPKGNMGFSLYQDDAAILKKQIPFHCLSCDKSIMVTPQTLIPPDKGGVPPNKRNRPISAHEADPSRLLKQRVQVRKSFIKPLDKMLLEGKDNKLYQGQQIEIPEEGKEKTLHKDQLPPLNGATPSKSEHTLSRMITGIPERLIENKSSLSSRNIVIQPDES